MKFELFLAFGFIGLVASSPTDFGIKGEGFNLHEKTQGSITPHQQKEKIVNPNVQQDQPQAPMGQLGQHQPQAPMGQLGQQGQLPHDKMDQLPKGQFAQGQKSQLAQDQQGQIHPQQPLIAVGKNPQKAQMSQMKNQQQSLQSQAQAPHQRKTAPQKNPLQPQMDQPKAPMKVQRVQQKTSRQFQMDQPQVHQQVNAEKLPVALPKTIRKQRSEEQRKPLENIEQARTLQKMPMTVPLGQRQQREQGPHKGSMAEERKKRPMSSSMRARANWEEDQHKKPIDLKNPSTYKMPEMIKIKRSTDEKADQIKEQEQIERPKENQKEVEGLLTLPMKVAMPLNKDAMKEEARPRPVEPRQMEDDPKAKEDSLENARKKSHPLQIESIMIKASRQRRQYGFGSGQAAANAQASATGTGFGTGNQFGGYPYGGYGK